MSSIFSFDQLNINKKWNWYYIKQQFTRLDITQILFPVLHGLFLTALCCSESWILLHHMLIIFYGDILLLVYSADLSIEMILQCKDSSSTSSLLSTLQVWLRSVNMSHTVTIGRDQQQNTPALLSPSAITWGQVKITSIINFYSSNKPTCIQRFK